MNCYNSDKYLREAIDSVYAQTYHNWEIIFWDNASTDNSSRIAKSYDQRLRYYSAAKKTLLGKARNLALAKASGDYVAFLDCDDVWLNHKLESQMNLLRNCKNDDIGFIYGRCEIFFQEQENKNRIFKQGETLVSGYVFDELIKDNFVLLLTAIIDKDKLIECGGFPDNYMHSEDYWVFLQLAKRYHVKVDGRKKKANRRSFW